MSNLNNIGINQNHANELVLNLNNLLANFQIYYQNLRGLHWNIKGKRFFDLHVKFEEYYNDSQLKIDLIAERILTLSGQPLHTFQDYLNKKQLTIGKDITNDVEAIELINNNLSDLLKIERSILQLAQDANDEGTNSMISDFISEQEKLIWMLNAWLS